MSGLQTIIDSCQSIEIDRRKVVGLQVTRNEVIRRSLLPTFNPWRFKVTMPSRFRYNEARALLEALDRLDRIEAEKVKFGNKPELAWLFKYQGQMSPQQISGITVQSFTGNTLILDNLPAKASTAVLFKPNDLIQIGNRAHPFTVQQEVLRGSGSTVSILTHRPNILTLNPVGQSITVGANCEFNLLCVNMPTYRLKPGGFVRNGYGAVANNALIEFSSEFQFQEWVATA